LGGLTAQGRGQGARYALGQREAARGVQVGAHPVRVDAEPGEQLGGPGSRRAGQPEQVGEGLPLRVPGAGGALVLLLGTGGQRGQQAGREVGLLQGAGQRGLVSSIARSRAWSSGPAAPRSKRPPPGRSRAAVPPAAPPWPGDVGLHRRALTPGSQAGSVPTGYLTVSGPVAVNVATAVPATGVAVLLSLH
jgi:hypothetical protein